MRGYLQNQLQEKLERDSTAVVKILQQNAALTSIKEILLKSKEDVLFKLLKGQLETNIAILSSTKKEELGKISYISRDIYLTDENLNSIQQALDKDTEFFKLTIQNQSYLAIIHQVERKKLIKNKIASKNINISQIVVAYTDTSSIQAFQRFITLMMISITCIIALVSFLVALTVSRKITNPILKLTHFAKKLSDRNFTEELTITTNDELEFLADALKSMSKSISAYDTQQKEFLQNISHELKTPLMAIQGYAEGIQENIFKDNHQALTVIVAETKRIKSIVDDIIYLSKLEMLEQDVSHYTKCNINDMVILAIEKIESLALQQDIEILFEPKEALLSNIDKDQILRAIINILSNCLKYTKDLIQINIQKDNHSIKISIKDNGNGFSKVVLDKMFDRFYKGEKEGSGLGLSIVHKIMENHNGSITALNHATGGAEFILQLPY